MASFSVRLPDDLDRRLNRQAKRARKSRAELAREAIAGLVRARERERFASELFAEARDNYADSAVRREAKRIAAEFEFADHENTPRGAPRAKWWT